MKYYVNDLSYVQFECYLVTRNEIEWFLVETIVNLPFKQTTSSAPRIQKKAKKSKCKEVLKWCNFDTRVFVVNVDCSLRAGT